MTARTHSTNALAPSSIVKPVKTRSMRLPHYIALLAVPIALTQIWTVASWLADGPFSTTATRDRQSASWYAAHSCEVAMLLLSIPVILHLYRDCKARGRFLTFDVIFCIGGATMWWAD